MLPVARLVFLVWCTMLLVPAAVYAQAAIAGTVKDASGAVLPGVTIEASSDRLIERIRTAVTDGSGQYRIIDLPGGTYVVTFSLPAFQTVRRDDIQLIGAFTATVDVELQPGNVTEVVTVSGTAPIVDVQSPRRQQTLDHEIINALPVSRTYFGLAALTPGIEIFGSAQDAGGINAGQVTSYTGYGGASRARAPGTARLGEGRLLVDGVSVGGSAGGSGTGYYTADVTTAQEVSLTITGGLGESEVSGPVFNVVPRTGGNTARGTFLYNFANGAFQDDNRTDDILTLNPTLRKQDEFIKYQEFNGSFGSAIRKDRIWYYVAARHLINDQYASNMWFNKNAGDSTKWLYEPDYTRPAFSDRRQRNASIRLTVQLTSKQKMNLFWDEQSNPALNRGGGTGTSTLANASPEASMTSNGSPQRVSQVTWQSPRSNRLLLEASGNRTYTKYGNYERPDNPHLIRVTETLQPVQGGTIPLLSYRAQQASYTLGNSPRWQASASYVTGRHNLRVGYQGFYTQNDPDTYNTYDPDRLAYTFTNGLPSRVTQYLLGADTEQQQRVMSQSAYVQEQWTRRRLTVGAALRFDFAKSWYEDWTVGPDRWLPTEVTFKGGDSVTGFKDFTPRMSAAFDLFGDGTTALRFTLGRYLEAATNGARYVAQHPFNRLSSSTSRTWTDANGNYRVDCDLSIYTAAQDLRAVGGDSCGIPTITNFGTANLTSLTTTYEPELLGGWGVRPDDWNLSLSVQRQLFARVSAEVAYTRRMFGLYPVDDNLSVTPADYLTYSLTAPVDSRIGPASGRVLTDLWALSQEGRLRGTSTLRRRPIDSEHGGQSDYWHGVDVTMNARMQRNLTFRGGVSVGREVNDTCNVRPDNPSQRNCHIADPFQPRVSVLGMYTIPRIDVQLSGTYQGRPGAERSVNVNVPVAQTGLPAGTFTTTTVLTNFLETGEMFGERIDEVDLKVAKVLRLMGKRVTAGFEVYNALNSSDALTYNNTYSLTGTNAWGQPLSLVSPRYAKFSMDIDF
ncbi:MAG TPA: carboxypeptidase regulatory-like domain-containing protein [Vicinamibacterales bacterium]|nr:carboxypeptidase regulatory-like domain-containing protein [Vicinamibacterales bacterium]